MDTGNTTGEIVAGIEESGIGIGYLRGQSQHFMRDAFCRIAHGFGFLQQLHGFLRPYRPVAQQPADDPFFHNLPVDLEAVLRQQIHNNIVVITGIESDFITPLGHAHRPHDIQRLVTVERRDFYRHHAGYVCYSAPEVVAEQPAAD